MKLYLRENWSLFLTFLQSKGITNCTYSHIENYAEFILDYSYRETTTLCDDFCSFIETSFHKIITIDDDRVIFITKEHYVYNYELVKNKYSPIIGTSGIVLIERGHDLSFEELLPTVIVPNGLLSDEKTFGFSFRNMENVFLCKEYFSDCDINNTIRNYNLTDTVINPLFLLVKNKNGVGNTVVLRGSNALDETYGYKTLATALKEDIFWQKVLLPLAKEDFHKLKEEIESQSPSLNLFIKEFNLKLQHNAIEEINILKTSEENSRQDIFNLEYSLCREKIKLKNIKKTIQDREQSLYSLLDISKLKKEIELIKALPYITEIVLDGSNIGFYTTPIQIDDGPTLGGYEISYNILSSHLHITNLVNPMHGCEHPHIQHGTICYGNFSDVPVYFNSGDFLVGIELLHKFLSTYNADDEWGDALIYWDAEYAFRNIIDLGNLREVSEEYDSYYFDIYGEHLPQANVCPDCGELEEDCTCNRCPYCNGNIEYCECWICPECGGEVGNDCRCDRCSSCSELIEDCECERCSECGELIEDCGCDRCPQTDELVDEELCKECESWECEYNTNEGHATTQEETLFEVTDTTNSYHIDF